eukprot:CAMPEP_0198142164 /NCGR_PEP_ID=MMETSP1443-20131203/5031_1 /TAXON_ID=186043 /ORGANISM="Entomoneis sp., Strain CCMP2396" /LENGTH=197 /DNA_ID=CAMNT_0043805121 /DNA_START=193 /DNA_END=786 /DNA_ORIENTATION=-
MPLSTVRQSSALNGGAQGYATSIGGKTETISQVKELLNASEMIFSIPASALTVKETEKLRLSVPETTTIRVVKNKLMKIAVDSTDYSCLIDDPLLKGANLWFFIEDDISGTIKSLKPYYKETGKSESHAIQGGVLEGVTYDNAGIDAIGKLPSKLELYAQIAGSIKAVPTKVARVIKAGPNKLAKAIKLATDENNKE